MSPWITAIPIGWLGGLDKDLCGYVAAALVLATFSMTSMRNLRLTAVASNVAFILYASIAHLPPVLLLHGLLLPLNIIRLAQIELARFASTPSGGDLPQPLGLAD